MPNSPWPYKFQANCGIMYVLDGGGGGGGGGSVGREFLRVVCLRCPGSVELGCLWGAVPWLGVCLIYTFQLEKQVQSGWRKIILKLFVGFVMENNWSDVFPSSGEVVL